MSVKIDLDNVVIGSVTYVEDKAVGAGPSPFLVLDVGPEHFIVWNMNSSQIYKITNYRTPFKWQVSNITRW